MRRAQPPQEIARFNFKASRWRRFERLSVFPLGLIPFGDAICRFNPIYGQGMSMAAIEAVVLRNLLAGLASSNGGPMRPQAFFAETQACIEAAWESAAVPDFIDPRTQGERPHDFEQKLKFGGALLKLAAQDPAVHKLMLEVQGLLKPPISYRDPDFLGGIREEMSKAGAAN